ncbi:hypothetical protein AKO1_000549, partial [Acrasis kona]
FFCRRRICLQMPNNIKVPHKFTADGSGRDRYIFMDPVMQKGATHTEPTQYDHMERVNEFWTSSEKKYQSSKNIVSPPAELTDTQRRRQRMTVNSPNSPTQRTRPRQTSDQERSYFNETDVVRELHTTKIPGYQGHVQNTHDHIGVSTFGKKEADTDGTTYTTSFENSKYVSTLPLPSFQTQNMERAEIRREQINETLHKHTLSQSHPSVHPLSATTGAPSTFVKNHQQKPKVRNASVLTNHHISGYAGHQPRTGNQTYDNYSVPIHNNDIEE